MTSIFQSFMHKMAAKINWHRYGTNLRHCHPVYTCSDVDEASVQTTPGLGDGLQSGIPLHLVIIPDRCKTFRVKHVSCNKLLYKLTLFPAVRFAAVIMLMHFLQFVL